MKLTNLLSTLAVASLVLAPAAAQAGSAASSAMPKLTKAGAGQASVRRTSAVAKKDGAAGGFVLGAVALAAVVGAVVIAADGDDKKVSNGTN